MKKENILKCSECNFATPANTNGIGNPIAPEGDIPGSGDLIGISKKPLKRKNKKKSHLKEYVIEKLKITKNTKIINKNNSELLLKLINALNLPILVLKNLSYIISSNNYVVKNFIGYNGISFRKIISGNQQLYDKISYDESHYIFAKTLNTNYTYDKYGDWDETIVWYSERVIIFDFWFIKNSTSIIYIIGDDTSVTYKVALKCITNKINQYTYNECDDEITDILNLK